MVYCWDFFESQERPKWLSVSPKMRFVVEKEFSIHTPDSLAPLPGSIFYLVAQKPITVKPGTYEVYEVEGGGLLFAGPEKFPAVADEDDLNALADVEVGMIRFI